MTDLIPEGFISLIEAFERFRRMRHGSLPEWIEQLPDDPEKRKEWEKYCLDAHRNDLDVIRGAFEAGQLRALVWRTGRKSETNKAVIEQDDWRRVVDVAGLFLFDEVFDFHDGPMGSYLGRRPFVAEANVQDWLEANDPDAIHAERQRWGLLATLAWIATREITLSRLADQAGNALNSIDILLRDWALKADPVRSKTWPYRTASDAWERELIPTLSAGKLKASAARTIRHWDGGTEQTELGQTFPPEKAPAAAEHHIIVDRNGEPTLFPDGAQRAQKWVEWTNLCLDVREVVALWPERDSVENDETSTGNVSSPKRRKVPQRDLEGWFKKRVKAWPKDDPTPTQADDWVAAAEAFPQYKVSRIQLREARATSTPSHWRKQGPKKPKR